MRVEQFAYKLADKIYQNVKAPKNEKSEKISKNELTADIA